MAYYKQLTGYKKNFKDDLLQAPAGFDAIEPDRDDSPMRDVEL